MTAGGSFFWGLTSDEPTGIQNLFFVEASITKQISCPLRIRTVIPKKVVPKSKPAPKTASKAKPKAKPKAEQTEPEEKAPQPSRKSRRVK